ncbi:biotin/lipoyl-binding protein, partial [Leucobacter soli]
MRDGQGTGRRIVPKLRTTLFAAGGILTAGALIVVGTSLASALSSGASFRTATAESATVTETVNANGTVASATRRDLAFQTGGTVERVRVSVGDTVAAGDTLAVLDRSELEEAIADAEQAVADAEQTLAEHQEAQATGTTDTSATVSSSTAVSSTAVSNMTTSNTVISNAVASNAAVRKSAVQNTAATVDPAVTEARTKVTDAQEAMLTEYTRVQGEIDTTDGLIATASETCRVFLHAALAAGDDDSSGGDGSGGAAEDPGTDPGTAAGMTLEEAQAALAACQAEITTVQAAQVSIGEG